MRGGEEARVAVDVLVVLADEALATVLEIALRLEGCTVRTAADEGATVAALQAHSPRILLVDGTAPFAAAVLERADRHTPSLPLILLISGLTDGAPLPDRPAAVLRMPFRREDLRRALAAVQRAEPNRGA
jgi:DNA-binding NtrC family response regulator